MLIEDIITELRVTKPDAEDTLGIPRLQMPQVAKIDYPEFVEYLRSHGVKLAKPQMLDAKKLQPIQSEFNDDNIVRHVKRNLKKALKGRESKPIITSEDGYIIDGHHRWLAAVNVGNKVPAIVANTDGKNLLQLVLDFPKVTFAGIE